MKIFITSTFKRAAKKLHQNQLTALKKAINKIKKIHDIGEIKIGDLAGVRVYKFRMLRQQILLAYTYSEAPKTITLLIFASHENFYNNLKKQVKSN